MSQGMEKDNKVNQMAADTCFISENAVPPPTVPRSPGTPLGPIAVSARSGRASRVSGSTDMSQDVQTHELRRKIAELEVARSEQTVEEMQLRAQIAEMEQVIQELQAQTSSRASAVQDEYKVRQNIWTDARIRKVRWANECGCRCKI